MNVVTVRAPPLPATASGRAAPHAAARWVARAWPVASGSSATSATLVRVWHDGGSPGAASPGLDLRLIVAEAIASASGGKLTIDHVSPSDT